jgi:hypothetical protein
MKRKPLDPSGKACRRCGNELTVIRSRRTEVCRECEPSEVERRRQVACEEMAREVIKSRKLVEAQGYPPEAWVRWSTSPYEAVRRFEFRRLAVRQCGFSFWNVVWPERSEYFEAVTALCEPGDRVSFFRAPEATWRTLCGREGFAVFREGKAVKVMTTCLN